MKTAVGDQYVVEEMRKGNYNLGGEQSGHIIFLDYNTTGDGLLTGLQLVNIMKRDRTETFRSCRGNENLSPTA